MRIYVHLAFERDTVFCRNIFSDTSLYFFVIAFSDHKQS